MKQNQILITAVMVIIFAGVGFFSGMQYQKSQATSFAGGNFAGARNGQAGNVQGARGGGRMGGGQVVGEVTSADNNSVTVKLADGSSKIVLITSNTSISKAAPGTQTDLATGTRVGVFGTTNTDGSVTAQNIQINPIARGPATTGSPSGTPTK